VTLSNGWQRTTLGDLGRYLNGRAFKRAEWRDEGRPIIRIQNLTGSSDTFNYFQGEADDRHVVRHGDLLVSWAATLGAYLWDGPEAVLNQHIFKVESRIEKRFHKYLLDHKLDDLKRHTHGSGMVHITRRAFDSVPVDVPDLGEQRRIVELLEDHLSRLDAADAYLETGRRRLDAMEQAALANCRDGELRPLADVTEIQGGIQKQPKRAPRDNAHPFLRVANVTARGLELDDVHQIELFNGELDRLKLQAGDLLVVEGNGSPSQIGRAALWDGSITNCVHQNHLIRVRPMDRLLPEYLEAVWNSPENRARLTQVASSSSGLHTLSVSKLKQLSVPVPSIARQRELVDEVVGITDIGARLGASIATAAQRKKALRRSLLAAAFSGQLTAETAIS
jgi:type I restriction enzyme S subunit